MNHIAIFFEHVDLLNRLNGLDIELFQGSLQLFVVRTRRLVNLLHFSPRCTLASVCEDIRSVTPSMKKTSPMSVNFDSSGETEDGGIMLTLEPTHVSGSSNVRQDRGAMEANNVGSSW